MRKPYCIHEREKKPSLTDTPLYIFAFMINYQGHQVQNVDINVERDSNLKLQYSKWVCSLYLALQDPLNVVAYHAALKLALRIPDRTCGREWWNTKFPMMPRIVISTTGFNATPAKICRVMAAADCFASSTWPRLLCSRRFWYSIMTARRKLRIFTYQLFQQSKHAHTIGITSFKMTGNTSIIIYFENSPKPMGLRKTKEIGATRYR